MQENNEIPVRSEQELTELLKIRREKLSALRGSPENINERFTGNTCAYC